MIEVMNETITKKIGDKVLLQPAQITSFIKCGCEYCGGLIINGIEVDYHTLDHGTDIPRSSYVNFNIVRVRDMAIPHPTLWERIKSAWSILRNKDVSFLGDDIVLGHTGMVQLQNSCKVILENWPTSEQLSLPRPSLEEIMKSLEGES